MKKGCCEDVQLCFKKSSVDHQTSSAVLFFAAALPVEPQKTFVFEQKDEVYVPKNIKPSVNAPPPELRIPTYLKHCVFII